MRSEADTHQPPRKTDVGVRHSKFDKHTANKQHTTAYKFFGALHPPPCDFHAHGSARSNVNVLHLIHRRMKHWFPVRRAVHVTAGHVLLTQTPPPPPPVRTQIMPPTHTVTQAHSRLPRRCNETDTARSNHAGHGKQRRTHRRLTTHAYRMGNEHIVHGPGTNHDTRLQPTVHRHDTNHATRQSHVRF